MHKASSLQCIHYADDTTLFSKSNNFDDLIDFTNTNNKQANSFAVPKYIFVIGDVIFLLFNSIQKTCLSSVL